jgi:predicted alpha-1,6-mannanase (GH76 family)
MVQWVSENSRQKKKVARIIIALQSFQSSWYYRIKAGGFLLKECKWTWDPPRARVMTWYHYIRMMKRLSFTSQTETTVSRS